MGALLILLLPTEFPERPGALRKFLVGLKSTWSITLFHYRNQGADIGRVLVGLQVPPAEGESFTRFLNALNYTYVEETDNVVFKTFLS